MHTLDLLISNATIVDVFRLTTYRGWVGVRDGRFLYVEPGDAPRDLAAAARRDLAERFLLPGLVDAHMHIESSLVTPRRFAQAAVVHGTTAVLADPHEVANVAGEEGVRWMIRASEGLPLRIYFAIPSCVPATSPELEWTAAVFDGDVIARLADEPAVIALGEVMDYRSVLAREARLARIVQAARTNGLLVEGHVPMLSGTDLSEYLAWQITSDHTLMNPGKIREETSKGVAVMFQALTIDRDNMAAAMALPEHGNILLVTDDVEPGPLAQGHLSRVVRLAIDAGLPPLQAIASATIRPARYLGLRYLGAIAPGFRADWLVADDVAAFPPREVWVNGRQVAGGGVFEGGALPDLPRPPANGALPGPFEPADFRLDAELKSTGDVTANAVVLASEVLPRTGLERVRIRLIDGFARLDTADEAQLALIAIVARNGMSRTVGIVKDLGLRDGAFASSYAHDSHHLIVIGRDPVEMALAANAVGEMGGGVVAVRGRQVVARLALPILGLLCDENVAAVALDFNAVEHALRAMGVRHRQPFLMLSLLSLSVSPQFKFTDKGVIDTERRQLLPPWVR